MISFMKKNQVRLWVTDFDNWMWEGTLLAGVSPWGANKRKHKIFHRETVVRNNHGNIIIWACQVVKTGFCPPTLFLIITGPMWKQGTSQQDNSGVWRSWALWSKESVLWHCCFFCIQAMVWAMHRGLWPLSSSREDIWLHSSRMLSIQPCKDGLSKSYGGKRYRGKETDFDVLGNIRWERRTPFFLCRILLIKWGNLRIS